MDNQKRAYFIGGLAVVLVISVIIWFACAGRSTVHDLRNGSNDIRNELESAQDRQREEGQAVDTANMWIIVSAVAVGAAISRR